MSIWLLSLLVNNHFGVLTRVTGLFSRRGYNIASLSVGETHVKGLSRITIGTFADGAGIHQIMKQLQKLEDVKRVLLLPGAETVARELMLIKLVLPLSRRDSFFAALEGFSYHIPYADDGRLLLEFTGAPAECTELLDILSDYTILELCRTGATALSTTGTFD